MPAVLLSLRVCRASSSSRGVAWPKHISVALRLRNEGPVGSSTQPSVGVLVGQKAPEELIIVLVAI